MKKKKAENAQKKENKARKKKNARKLALILNKKTRRRNKKKVGKGEGRRRKHVQNVEKKRDISYNENQEQISRQAGRQEDIHSNPMHLGHNR